MALKLIVGLGNPGDNYTKTRHNAGFWWADDLAEKLNIDWQDKKNRQEASHLAVKIIKPQEYMNNSGKAVASLVNFYKIKPAEILIVHDDLDLAAGVIKLKQQGGLGGHNGLKSIDKCLGFSNFNRLRIGIGRPLGKEDVSSFVLKKPVLAEYDLICLAITTSLNHVDSLLAADFDHFMKTVHTKRE